MGDANQDIIVELCEKHGLKYVHAHHETAAVGMADGRFMIVRRSVASGGFVLQNSFWGCVKNFLGSLMRSPGNYVGGHMIDPISNREFFVSSLRAMASPNIHSDGCAAKFCRQLVFEFCNTIGGIADTPNL